MRVCNNDFQSCNSVCTATALDPTADVAGCVDATQVADVIRQWHANGNVAWKLPLLERVPAVAGVPG